MGNPLPVADELPADALELVEKASKEIGKLQEQLRKQVARLQAKFDEEVAELTGQSEQKIQSKIEVIVKALKPLQISYAREGMLDEALAIRDQIKQLSTAQSEVLPDPGSPYAYAADIGNSFSFEVTGHVNGAVWGTDVYTTDSCLAVAAVHAGKIQIGERKKVRITIITPPAGFQGSTRNGVTTGSYGPYQGAYRFA